MKPTETALSVVIPVHNEAGNVKDLHTELVGVLRALERPSEIIFVNDASTDGTLVELQRLAPVKIVDLASRSGQAAAIKAGFDEATGEVVISMDGDGQNDPADIPRLLATLDRGFDVVASWRQLRMDTPAKVFVSRLGARVQRWLLRDDLHDSSCTLRAYRSWVLGDLDLRGGLHRFLPAILKMRGAKIGEVAVTDRPRRKGSSKYGLAKVFPGLVDLGLVWFRQRYQAQPAHFFARLGLGMLLLSFGAGLAAIFAPAGEAALTPSLLAFVALLSLVVAAQFMVLGFLVDAVTQRSPDDKPYRIRRVLERGGLETPDRPLEAEGLTRRA